MLRRDNNGSPGSASRFGAPVGGPAGKAGPRGTSGLGPPRVGGPMTLLGGPKVSAAQQGARARRDTQLLPANGFSEHAAAASPC